MWALIKYNNNKKTSKQNVGCHPCSEHIWYKEILGLKIQFLISVWPLLSQSGGGGCCPSLLLMLRKASKPLEAHAHTYIVLATSQALREVPRWLTTFNTHNSM